MSRGLSGFGVSSRRPVTPRRPTAEATRAPSLTGRRRACSLRRRGARASLASLSPADPLSDRAFACVEVAGEHRLVWPVGNDTVEKFATDR